MKKPAKGELPRALVARAVEAALEEDLGAAGDITTDATIPVNAKGEAAIVAREAGVIAGLDLAAQAFLFLDPEVKFSPLVSDGELVKQGAKIAKIAGKTRAILTAERTALNFLGHLSGVATLTSRFVEAVAGTGVNHRFGLYDGVLIKDNHIAAAGGIGNALRALGSRAGHMVRIEVEVDNLDQLKEALRFPIDAVLLDNMDVPTLKRAVAMVGGRVTTEASGGVRLETVRKIAETGIDLISAGALTHSARRLDLSLEWARRSKTRAKRRG
jgi:nicotinate-nucleotide pyrophosphorylase (carboxylating)